MSHTPGPWALHSPTLVCGNMQRDQNGTSDLVATTVTPDDARLIAAAPCLLEALREMLEMGELFIPAKLDSPGFKRARAAISRAEGQ